MRKLLLIVVCLGWMVIGTTATAGSLWINGSYVPNGHSEGTTDRCINEGWGADIGYEFDQFKYEP